MPKSGAEKNGRQKSHNYQSGAREKERGVDKPQKIAGSMVFRRRGENFRMAIGWGAPTCFVLKLFYMV